MSMSTSKQTSQESRREENNVSPHSSEIIENAAQKASHLAKEMSQKASNAMGSVTQNSASMTQTYLLEPVRRVFRYLWDASQTNTSLRYFTLTFLAFSIIPLSMFAIFLIGSLGGTVMVAMMCVTLVESVILFPAAFILGLCLLGATGLTTTIFGSFITAWFSVAAFKVFSTKANNIFGGVAATVKSDLDALDRGAYRGTTY